MNNIYISRNRKDLDIGQIEKLLRGSSWAAGRSKEDIIQSVEHSICYGILHGDDELIGFARIITDITTTFYLMDVIIEESYRGNGIGKMLMDEIMKDVGHLCGILHTDSARGFYEQYGFKVTAISETGESIMEKPRGSR